MIGGIILVRDVLFDNINLFCFGFSWVLSLLKFGDVFFCFKVRFFVWESKSFCFWFFLDNFLVGVLWIGNSVGVLILFSERFLFFIISGGGDWGEEGLYGFGGEIFGGVF